MNDEDEEPPPARAQPRCLALLDCRNFYCSCERLFDPRLRHKPVVVLSNNDGCIIARSDEAKALGIAMGTPYHLCRELLERHEVAVFSSNYALYGDMSRRVMQTIGQFVPRMEVYSIDEAFLDLGECWAPEETESRSRKLRDTVRQWTGIPVGIGIGPTKVLAKAGNHFAKKRPEFAGVCTVEPGAERLLASLPCADVWGIGRASAEKLAVLGVRTAWDLARAEPAQVRARLGVVGERIARELRGTSCLGLEEVTPPKKAIASSRSFGRPVERLDELEEAVSTYVSRAAEKLRAQGSVAAFLSVYLVAGRFAADPRERYVPQFGRELPGGPTDYTPALTAVGLELLRRIFRRGFRYGKAGVLLGGLGPRTGTPGAERQRELFRENAAVSSDDPRRAERRARLMQTVDGLNARHGRGTVFFAASGNPITGHTWRMRHGTKPRAYTTSWAGLSVGLA